jgi:hypothetical protein
VPRRREHRAAALAPAGMPELFASWSGTSPFDRLTAGIRENRWAAGRGYPREHHGFAPRGRKPGANKARKQLGGDPMGHQHCLCEAARRVGEYPNSGPSPRLSSVTAIVLQSASRQARQSVLRLIHPLLQRRVLRRKLRKEMRPIPLDEAAQLIVDRADVVHRLDLVAMISDPVSKNPRTNEP